MDRIVNVKIDLTNSINQEFSVRLRWQPTNISQIFLFPIWTPGSYKVRDHVQNLHSLKVLQEDIELQLIRLETSKWKCKLNNLEPIDITYIIEARNLTVRTSYVSNDIGSISMPSAVLLIEEAILSPHYLSVSSPSDWKISIPLIKEGEVFKANNYDELLDAPLMAGYFQQMSFNLSNKVHELIIIGEHLNKLPSTIIHDIRKICLSASRLFNNELPKSEKYIFYIHLLDKGYGGLEHDNSCVIHYSRRSLSDDNGYRRFLQLVGHEYLHQWNVRRLRPKEYISYNYTNVVITDSLWFAEGITSYYDLALPLVSGITSKYSLLDDLSKDITNAFTIEGRYIHSIADSSRESWIKLYNSTLASTNTQISYYKFGTMLAFCLDIYLRLDGYSLSDLLKIVWNNYGVNRSGYTRDDIKNELVRFNIDLPSKLDLWLDLPNSLPILDVINKIGLILKKTNEIEIYTGMIINKENSILVLKSISTNSPAYRSELIINDEIVAINNYRVKSIGDLELFLEADKDNNITYVRNGILLNTNIKPKNKIKDEYKLFF